MALQGAVGDKVGDNRAGWRIELDPDYRYDLAEPQDWYAELNEEGEGVDGWFALELGILVDGQRHALLPLLLQMIRRAPQEFDAAALAARDDADDLILDLPGATRVVLPWDASSRSCPRWANGTSAIASAMRCACRPPMPRAWRWPETRTRPGAQSHARHYVT